MKRKYNFTVMHIIIAAVLMINIVSFNNNINASEATGNCSTHATCLIGTVWFSIYCATTDCTNGKCKSVDYQYVKCACLDEVKETYCADVIK